jgi:hypothetical protein
MGGRGPAAWRASHASAAAAAQRAVTTAPPPRHAARSAGGLAALAVAAATVAAAAGYVYTGQHEHAPAPGAFPSPPAGTTAPAPQAGAAPASPPVDRAALLADLRAWLVAHGADIEAVDIRPCSEVRDCGVLSVGCVHSGGGAGVSVPHQISTSSFCPPPHLHQNSAGVGVFATPAVAARSRRGLLRTLADWAAWRSPDVVLASFPLSTAVTPGAALGDRELGPIYSQLLASGAADERALVMLFLALERAKGRASAWAPWLAALPRVFGTPLYFSAAERALLAGTNLGRAADLLSARLAAAWDKLAPSAARLASKAGLATPPSLADFTWAYSVFWSRGMAFPAPAVLSAGGVSVGGSGENPTTTSIVAQEGILPGLDFCNHAPGAPVRWTVYGAGGGGSGGGSGGNGGNSAPPATDPQPPPPTHAALVAPRWGVPAPGAEVLIDYGGKSQEELLLLYGFAHARAEKDDVLMVACPLPGVNGAGEGMAWDDDLRARVALLRCRGLTPQVFLPALGQGGSGGGGGGWRGWWKKGGGGSGGGDGTASTTTTSSSSRPRKASPVNPVAPGAGLPLPAGVWDTLEAFVLEPPAVAGGWGGREEGG